MSEHHRQDELSGLEAALKALRPAPPDLDRDRLMFRAGRAASRRPGLTWPALAAVAGIVFGIVFAYPLVRLTTPPVERVQIVHVPNPRPAPPDDPDEPPDGLDEPPADGLPGAAPSFTPSKQEVSGLALLFPAPSGGYFTLRDQVIRFGPDMLPSRAADSAGEGAPPMTLQQMYESLAEAKSEPAGE